MKPRSSLPGATTGIDAERTLVLAPHADDDLLGCGGLLARIARRGTGIRVLFLTDSSGGDEVTENRAAYGQRRRDEAARALRVLGIEDVRHLDIPDGRLARHVDDASTEIRGALLDLRPDLVLSVSPLENTDDHRAAFSALYRVLAPLRGDDELDRAVAGVRILLYEINQPTTPDILVDVSDQVAALSEAIEHHESQLELHNYLEAAVGLRRYRALSLPPSVTAAEGYRDLRLEDFVTHSHAGLIRALGGVPDPRIVREGPLVSVVVRTKDRPVLLAQALDSLAAGSYRRVEVVLVNDGGEPPAVRADFPLPVSRVELESNRGRAAAANAGVDAATGDYVGFLDDDDLAEPEHLETLVGLVVESGASVAYTDAAAGVYERDSDGGWREVARRLPYSRDFDPDLLLVDNYIPFNTILIERRLLEEVGPFDPGLEFFEDWDLLIRLSRRARFRHHRQVTCEYRHFRTENDQILGSQASQRPDFVAMKARVIGRHRDLCTPEALARAVTRLRGEAVWSAEDSAARAAEAADLRSLYVASQDAYHRLNGALQNLKAHAAHLEREAQELREARRVIDDQKQHLERLYTEVDRLRSLIEAMEGTKAWRLHRAVERLRGKGPQGPKAPGPP
jgi:LmbE family N-acetylglucosaminyl deacetylase